MTVTLFLAPNLDSALADAQSQIEQFQSKSKFLPVTWLAPGKYAAAFIRRQPGSRIGLQVTEFYQLGQAILDAAGSPVHCAGDATIRRLVSVLLQELATRGELTTFAPVAHKPGFTQAVLEWLREMKSQGIPPEAVSDNASSSYFERDQQLARLYARYQSFLQKNLLSDTDGLLWLAAEALETDPTLYNGSGLLIVLGFDQFTPMQVRILQLLSSRFGRFLIYLPWDANRPPNSLVHTRMAATRTRLELAFSPVITPLANSAESLPILQTLAATLLEPAALGQEKLEKSPAAQFIAAPSREAEVRRAVREIKKLLLDGMPPARIALRAPQPSIYSRLVETIAEEYGVPLRAEQHLVDNPALIALLSLLRLPPEFPRRETLDALHSPYFQQAWLSPVQIDQLDQLSRERPVIQGRDQWRFALQPLVSLTGWDDDDGLGPPRLASTLDPADLAAIDAGLSAFFDHLTPPAKASYRDHTLWLQESVLGIFTTPEDEHGELLPASQPGLQMAACCKTGPQAQRDRLALQQVLLALRYLVEAAESVPGPDGQDIPWSVYLADLQQIILRANLPPEPGLACVPFTALENGRWESIDHLFVLGLSEGEFPRLPAPDPFYTTGERQPQNETGETGGVSHPLPIIQPLPGEDASLWWQVLANCHGSLTLLRPWLDENGAEWLPSPYWDAVVDHWGAGCVEKMPVAGRPHPDEACSPEELLVALAAAGAGTVPGPLNALWQAVQHRYAVQAGRAGRQPVPAFEGYLLASDIQRELNHRYRPEYNWSASRLNSYGKCPYAFFAQTLLVLQEIADPVEGFDSMQRGQIMHALLEALFARLVERKLVLLPENQAAAQEILDEVCTRGLQKAPERYGFRPSALWSYEQDELRRMLKALLDWECAANAIPGFTPFKQELQFGIARSPLPSLKLETQDGQVFHLHGVIDRLDRSPAGELVVIDYKSGSTTTNKTDIEKGTAFQAPFYALAAERFTAGSGRVVESCYLLIPKREKSGRLTFREGQPSEDETVQAAVEKAGYFITRIQQGVFPTDPADPGYGLNACSRSCSFSGLCRVSRRSIAKAKWAPVIGDSPWIGVE